MNLIERVRQAERKAATSLGKRIEAPDWALAGAEDARWQVPDYSLSENQSKAYEAISWINTALQMVASMVALQPFQVMRLEGEKRLEINPPSKLWI